MVVFQNIKLSAKSAAEARKVIIGAGTIKGQCPECRKEVAFKTDELGYVKSQEESSYY